MDTKFWGPSGWKLLHTLTFTYQPTCRVAMRDFLATLPFILPCKFCRISLTTYMCADPPDLKNADSLSRWLWRIHNAINKKLRDQGQGIPPDPSYASVKQHYEKTVIPSESGYCESFPGWDFLFSIAFSYPHSIKGKPMPNTPERILKGHLEGSCDGIKLTPDQEKNRWNTLPPDRRLIYWLRFWKTLPLIMPPAWANAWRPGPMTFRNRKASTAWLWRIRCNFSHGADPYRDVCSKLASNESDCSSSIRARTCRKRSNKKGTRKQ